MHEKNFNFVSVLLLFCKCTTGFCRPSTGRNDDGTLMPIDMADSDWLLTKPDGTTLQSNTRITYTGWSYADLGNGQNSMWISTNGYYSTDQYYYLKSKNFTIPAGTSGLLNLRSLSFVIR